MKRLFTSCGLVALVVPSMGARAQTSQPPTGAPQIPQAAAAIPAQAGDIVVTAQRRSETAQRAAVAITAVSGDQLTKLGITDAQGLQKVLPSVEIKPEGSVSQTFIRGVGNNIDVPYTDPAVAYNLNGVFLPRYATGSAFFDLQRVEVLPGPQGTLYGGSAAGGVVNLVARPPENNFHGEAIIEGGNYGTAHGFIAQNAAISSTLSVRGAVDYERHDGYQSRGANSDDRISGRLSVLWSPSARVNLLVWGQGFHDGGKPSDAAYTSGNSGTTSFLIASGLIDPKNPWFYPMTGIAGNPIDITKSRKGYENYTFGAKLDIDIGDLILSYIPGFVLVRNNSLFYAGGFPLAVLDHENQVTQEIKLASGTASRFSWIAGLFYGHTSIKFHEDFFGAPVLDIPTQTNTSYAAYAQGTFKIVPKLRVTVGGRLSSDEKDAVGTSLNQLNGMVVPFSATPRRTRADFKVLLEGDVAHDVLLYAGVQSGYLPAPYTPAPNTATFSNEGDIEKLTSYTAGFKSRLLGEVLTLNSEAYYYDYRNYQVASLDLNSGITNIFEAQKARIYGDQTNIVFRPTREDTLSAGLGVLSTKFTTFVLPNGQNFTGNRLTDSPTFTASVDAQHRFDLSSGDNITLQVHSNFNSGYYGQYDNSPEVRQRHFNKTDLALIFATSSQAWSIRAYVQNVGDTAVYGAHASISPGIAAAFLDPPRTYGISINHRW